MLENLITHGASGTETTKSTYVTGTMAEYKCSTPT